MLDSIKTVIKQNPLMGRSLFHLVSRARGSWKYNPTYWLSRIHVAENAQVIQIGSHDGKSGDPLHALIQRNPRWRALFVEPVPILFDALCSNYGTSSRFQFENSAIGRRGGKAKFYYLSEDARIHHPDLPDWADKLGSFDRDHILKHCPQVVGAIHEVEVPVLTCSELMEKHGVGRLDILHIDTEGFDHLILKQIDFERLQPAAVLFEYKHMTLDDREEVTRQLEDSYLLVEFEEDILAVHKDQSDQLKWELKQLDPHRVHFRCK